MTLLKIAFLIISSLFVLSSIINFFVFLSKSYYGAAVWCLFTGISSSLVTHLNFLIYKNRLSRWYGLEELDYLNRLAFGLIAVTLSGLVYHSVYWALYYHYTDTYDFAAIDSIIYSAIAALWSLILKLLTDNIYGSIISNN